jgi:hypothetical protein
VGQFLKVGCEFLKVGCWLLVVGGGRELFYSYKHRDTFSRILPQVSANLMKMHLEPTHSSSSLYGVPPPPSILAGLAKFYVPFFTELPA